MKLGRQPIWQDGSKIELHHLIQREPGSMVELPKNMHQEYSRVLHGLVENGGSFRNDPRLKKQYNNFRLKYWKWRASEIEKNK
ncbi:HNH/ENDO VII family nuclease [Rossellomorea sp. BNER]|uniref:HNH/ENDO VII family nuclease n=1 Tax=Rossellomorea sp. BNER TaxID=2962031 RepID=UPI003AF2E708|nr:HNH/ENDO VII family nuclease [Rossellomorea sp. BNER]